MNFRLELTAVGAEDFVGRVGQVGGTRTSLAKSSMPVGSTDSISSCRRMRVPGWRRLGHDVQGRLTRLFALDDAVEHDRTSGCLDHDLQAGLGELLFEAAGERGVRPNSDIELF